VTTLSKLTCSHASIKRELVAAFSRDVKALLEGEPKTGRDAELSVWALLVTVGRSLLEILLASACWAVTEQAAEDLPALRLRMDQDYWITQHTTLGHVRVPLFAYRDRLGKTQAPAREQVFPLHPHCRSSALCLEWETKLGSQLPFRQAEDALTYFTHGACTVADTTIARHTAAIGGLFDAQWTYRSPEDVAQILREKATRDALTGRPLLYLSTDAHALRRYIDETWKAGWRMTNGLRLWCIDQTTGAVLHLGGEYTWGDCREVAQRVGALVERLVPTGEAAPQMVLLADGMPWIWEHVLPVLPADTVGILDFYHASSHLSDYAKARWGAESVAGTRWYKQARAGLLGKREYKKKPSSRRKGHKKRRRSARRVKRTIHLSKNPFGAGEALINTLLAEDTPASALEATQSLLHYLGESADRTDYPTYRARGIQIGSGAMESLHRTASQVRLKRAGMRWLAENAVAILNARMVQLAGRWDDFWGQDQLAALLKPALVDQAT